MKESILYLTSVLFLGLYSILYISPTAWRLVLLITIFFFFGKWTTKRFMKDLRVTMNHADILNDSYLCMASKGEEVEIPLTLVNTGKLPIPFLTLVSESLLNGISHLSHEKLSLMPGQKKPLPLHFVQDQAGLYKISLKEFILQDYLCLTSRKKKMPFSLKVLVLPTLYPLAMDISSSLRYFGDETEEFLEDTEGNDPSETIDIRPYNAGDKLSKIHWKLTSRTGELYVREYGEPIRLSVILLLDLSKLTEAYLEAAMSISAEMISQKCFHYISYQDIDGSLVRKKIIGEESMYMLLKELTLKLHESACDGKIASSEEDYRDCFGNDYSIFLLLDTNLRLFKNGELTTVFDDKNIKESLKQCLIEI